MTAKIAHELVEVSPEESAQNLPRPVWIRLPKPGCLEYWSHLSRATIERLLKLPGSPIVSRVITQPGTPGRGVRVILLQSLLDYIAAQPSVPPAALVPPVTPPNPAAGSRRPRSRKRKGAGDS